MIDVIIPTIVGREESLERCIDSYERLTDEDLTVIVVKDSRTCGEGWVAGLTRSTAPYIHFTSDDIEAMPGWSESAVEAVERGQLPCPVMHTPEGGIESCGGDMKLLHCLNRSLLDDWSPIDYTTVPFVSRKMVERIGVLPTHYSCDVWFSYRGRQLGYETVIRRGYELIHHQEQVGRGAGVSQFERSEKDRVTMERALLGQTELSGEALAAAEKSCAA